MNSHEKNMILRFFFGAVGTMAALWFLYVSYREVPALRGYLQLSRM